MDLSNPANWLLLYTQSKQVTYLDSGGNPDSRNYYPLEPSELQVSSPILVVSLESETASQWWIRGGWASLFASVIGSPTAIGKKSLRLYQRNLVNFPYYGEELIPFTLRLEFPWWLRDIAFQVWEFQDSSGRYLTSPVEQSLLDLEERLNGESVTLSSVSYLDLTDGDRVLQQSVFVGNTRYERYEIGRFYRTDTGEKLSDPLLTISPGSFRAVFTGIEKLPPNVVTVSVKPL